MKKLIKFLLLSTLTTTFACAVDPDSSTATDDPTVDDARPPVHLAHCLDQPAPPQDTATSKTLRPPYAGLGGFDVVDQPVGIASGGVSGKPALAVLSLPAGTIVTGIAWSACGNGSADAIGAVWVGPSLADLEAGPAGRIVHHGSGLDSDHPDQWSTFTVPDFVPQTIKHGDVVGVFFTPYDGPGYVIGTVTITTR